ncbi:hypothetical protein AVP42_02765 [Agromyces sp. NDB4Y10]|uniref:GDSL-type esterase/lipase family protein n=1 Tax=Agromyces sp. NDB4Y10 TaxID=1775951 RepID=UPI0007B1B369|nr:GDSL-type esterase/lipase family protein [Agromyces sp. NDB4Y10]KZE92163.1 hypothetical protein AVP42_02765 [Agromyces sp. NDB4Y10]
MHAIPITPDLISGVLDSEVTSRGGIRVHRLPRWVREQFPDPQLMMAAGQPAGVRVAFVTSATVVELVVHATRVGYRGFERPRGNIELAADRVVLDRSVLSGGDVYETDLRTGQVDLVRGDVHVARFEGLPARSKRVEIWLPHNESVELLELRADEAAVPAPSAGPVWVHHGSSISQGSNATSPTGTWVAVAAQRAGVDLRNLGVGGSAAVDPFMARVIRDTPADLISLKLGINVVNLDAMRRRAFVPAVRGFLDTIREGHPRTPILVISPLYAAIHENTVGPTIIDPASFDTGRASFVAAGDADETSGRLTLRVVRDLLATLVQERQRDDAALQYLDGTVLYGEADAQARPLPDGLHPDSATHRVIGERFADFAFAADGPFAGLRWN